MQFLKGGILLYLAELKDSVVMLDAYVLETKFVAECRLKEENENKTEVQNR